ncbi:MAG: hypothetical protein WCP45_05505 [Verrucomicrobiota bacterium]
MNSDARFLLNFSLQSKSFKCIAVIGAPDSCKELVLEELAKLQLEHGEVVNVPSMPSLEDIHRHQRENTVIREGFADRPTFISSFLATNGFQQMPQVLVLSGFNCAPSDETYFLKTLLDERSHEDDDCYNELLAIILIMAPVGTLGTFDIDPDIRGCVAQIVTVKSSD